MRHNIGRTRAMGRFDILWMTLLLTTMFPAIVHPAASLTTINHAKPPIDVDIVFWPRLCHLHHTLLLIPSFTAGDRLFHLSTITASIHRCIASSTKPFVTFPPASVFSTWHQITANLSTTPSGSITRIDAALADRLLTAEAALYRAHVGTRWARSSVTKELTWMRALLRQNSRLPAGLTAGMRRNS